MAVFGLFAWLNFDYSRAAYDAKIDGAHRGGVRHGFPLVAWDGGNEAHAKIVKKNFSLDLKPYGGWQWGGTLVDLAVFLAAITATSWFCEKLLRRTSVRSPAPRSPSLHAAVYAVVAISATGVLWANLAVRTDLVEFKDGTHDFQQEMGWPLRIYFANNPQFGEVVPPWREPTRDEKLILLQSNTGGWFQQAHWYTGNIVLNILIAMAIVLGLGGAMQFELQRRAKFGSADVVIPSPSD